MCDNGLTACLQWVFNVPIAEETPVHGYELFYGFPQQVSCCTVTVVFVTSLFWLIRMTPGFHAKLTRTFFPFHVPHLLTLDSRHRSSSIDFEQ
jgi:hypothetical protein